MIPSNLLSIPAVINYLASLHGLILALVIHRKSLRAFDANALLSWLLGLSSLSLAGATFYNGGGFRIWPHLLLFFDPFVLILPPLIYLYVQSRIHGMLSFRAGLAVHLIPFLINLVILFPFYTMPATEKIAYFIRHLQHPHPVSPVMAPRILFPIFYIAISILVLTRHTQSLPQSPRSSHQKNLRWLWHLLIGILVVWGAVTLIHFYIPVGVSEEEFSHLCNLLSSLFIFAMGYRVLLHPEILNRDISGAIPPKYEKTGVTDADAEQIWLRLEDCMESLQPYLEPSLALKTLAGYISVPQHQLSQVINQKSGDGFHSFLNEYRIRHACRLIDANPEDKLLSIAFASGFQSLSTFNRVFRDLTGQSPSQYRDRKAAIPS